MISLNDFSLQYHYKFHVTVLKRGITVHIFGAQGGWADMQKFAEARTQQLDIL